MWPAPAANVNGETIAGGLDAGGLNATEPMNWGAGLLLAVLGGEGGRAPVLTQIPRLRHTCAALLIAANLPAKAIQEHLGHSSYQITMDRYGHLSADASDAISTAMGAAFAGPAAAPSPVALAGNVTPLQSPLSACRPAPDERGAPTRT